jgi:hypothetical protein
MAQAHRATMIPRRVQTRTRATGAIETRAVRILGRLSGRARRRAVIHGDTSYVQPILQAALNGLRPRTRLKL